MKTKPPQLPAPENLNPKSWEKITWPTDPTVLAAFRDKSTRDPLETAYLLYRKNADGEWILQAVVEGDSALQKQQVLKRGEDGWRKAWANLNRWRNPPTWEESLAIMNKAVHYIADDTKDLAA